MVGRLRGGGEDTVPKRSLGDQSFFVVMRPAIGTWVVIPETDRHVRSAAHSGMHRAVCQEEAEG